MDNSLHIAPSRSEPYSRSPTSFPSATASPSGSMLSAGPSLAARKAALFEKFGNNPNNGGTNTGPASSSGSGVAPSKQPSAVVPSFSQPDWVRLVAERRERKESLAAPYVPMKKLSPVPTGSTIVDPSMPSSITLIGEASPTPSNTFQSASSRVRMAVAALNAMERTREPGPTWRVGATAANDDASVAGSRSWSRLSGATKVGDPITDPSKVEQEVGEDAEEFDTTQPLSIDTSLENFDTHPPNMVSPRTGLAYAILPPWARREVSPAPTPIATTPPRKLPSKLFPKKQAELATPSPSPLKKPLQLDALPEDVEVSPESSDAPTSTVAPTPILAPTFNTFPRRTAPIYLRGQGKPSAQKAHGRSVSVNTTPTPKPITPQVTGGHGRSFSRCASTVPVPFNLGDRERVRCTSTIPPAASYRRFSAQPTQFWNPPERLRRPSSVVFEAPSDPLMVKPQNKFPLRKVSTGAPKPMRFSMAF